MKKTKLLCILHYSPPAHGASKVGDFIKSSEMLKEEFDCRFIKIKSSNTLDDIGKMNYKKIYYVLELFLKILFTIIIFRPNKIYFTASTKGFAFYRDVLLSNIWKSYRLFKSCEIFYHYHTKGIKDFVKNSKNKRLTKYFLRDINLILLSPMLEDDFNDVKTYKRTLFLPNGVENSYHNEKDFEFYISNKSFNTINILYLSNMIKEKGYFEVLKLAEKNKNYQFHFAGGWQNKKDEKDFFNFIKDNKLDKQVIFHGFVNGKEKKELFENCHIFIFPTKYKNEAFPLSILEALSFGMPVLSTNEASIPYILDEKSGIVVKEIRELNNALNLCSRNLVNINTALYCRKRYLNNFTLNNFEKNLIGVLNG